MTGVELVEKVFAEHTVVGDPGFGNRPRLEAVAEYCAQTWPGDLVEIGLGHGNTTRIFAEIARAHDRRVVAVDPFDVMGTAWGDDYFETFLKNTEPWRDAIDLLKASSLDPETIHVIGERELCFAYVDGLHTYEACYSDILTVSHCAGIIAVDDVHVEYSYAEPIRRAFYDGAIHLNRIPMDTSLSREGYLIPGDQ